MEKDDISLKDFIDGGGDFPKQTSTEIPNERGRKHAVVGHGSSDMYFPDGIRRIDYVLAYSTEDLLERRDSGDTPEGDLQGTKLPPKARKRETYEKNLRSLGLDLLDVEGKYCQNTRFVLIHAPFKLLMKQAETLTVKMPVLESDVKERTVTEGVLDKFLRRFTFFNFDQETNERLKEPNYFTAPFVSSRIKCYVGSDNPDTFFDGSERSRMVYDLLIRTKYGEDDEEITHRIGISRLLQNGAYTAAYPLHEACENETYDVKECSNREMLYWKWAQIGNFYKYQPLSLIKKYFGSKVGIYFAWLGYYTKILMPASLIGFLFFLYGLVTFSQDIPSNDICGSDGVGAEILMCPTCNEYCDFTRLNSSCIYSKLSYVFDNSSTVFFAAIMSIIATLFLEGWKRYHAELAWKWGLLDFEIDEETVRPEYQVKVKAMKEKRFNLITQNWEPFMPTKLRLLRFIGSGVTVLFFLLLVLAFVAGVIIYRTVLIQVLYRQDSLQNYASLLTFSTAAVLNLIVILIMSYVYTFLAYKLTEWECPRTQASFESSYTFKVYLFQFINYYSSIFYIAFIKGNLSGVPGGKISGLSPEGCDPAGCMVELVIQLAIIMCGKQFFSAFVEIALPVLMKIFRTWRFAVGETEVQKNRRLEEQKKKEIRTSSEDIPRYERDYVLNPTYDQFLFNEYLEMVIQFGFVTLFVSAFPLAPLFALINNIIEIRMDAYKFTITSRRPMPERAKDIGMWLRILDGISKVAVLVNAFIISFTSDFIPKLVYQWVYNHDELYGYVNDSLSYFDASSLTVKWSEFAGQNITVCRFRDYREKPCTLFKSENCDKNYSITTQWWIVLAFRLAFVLVFEHIVFFTKALISYLIPDMPSKIFVQLQRQRFLARQARLSNMKTTGNNHPASPTESDNVANKSSDNWNQANADRKEVAFQPGLFEEDDENISQNVACVLKGSVH
ncbi:unnamed protein product [Enterobius vermicularis]|uniref:Anoctamin n=1 Tax=Enterobius vermicularis TaxID=51028 RepID=A0A0N4USF9_ENTVE|nr:unnamed protein product [Enterobius vermicularis]